MIPAPEPKVLHDPDRRFYVEMNDDVAYLAYRRVDEKTVDYVSTYVPPPLRGRGLAERIVRHALDWAREQGLTVIPTCSYVRRFVTR
jgi:predicted GNAT family acetyltransferase